LDTKYHCRHKSNATKLWEIASEAGRPGSPASGPSARTEEERVTVIRTIGSVWDGNEVSLIAGGGTLYFAFYCFMPPASADSTCRST
jgi:hypothetical protein